MTGRSQQRSYSGRTRRWAADAQPIKPLGEPFRPTTARPTEPPPGAHRPPKLRKRRASSATSRDGKTILDLAEGLQVSRVRVMGANGYARSCRDAAHAAYRQAARNERPILIHTALAAPRSSGTLHPSTNKTTRPMVVSGVGSCAGNRSSAGATTTNAEPATKVLRLVIMPLLLLHPSIDVFVVTTA